MLNSCYFMGCWMLKTIPNNKCLSLLLAVHLTWKQEWIETKVKACFCVKPSLTSVGNPTVEIRWHGILVDGGSSSSKVVATFNHVGGSFNFYGHHWGCLDNPIFSNLGLCAPCWAHVMCYHELRPTSVSHPFSLNSSLGFAGGKHYQKNYYPYL